MTARQRRKVERQRARVRARRRARFERAVRRLERRTGVELTADQLAALEKVWQQKFAERLRQDERREAAREAAEHASFMKALRDPERDQREHEKFWGYTEADLQAEEDDHSQSGNVTAATMNLAAISPDHSEDEDGEPVAADESRGWHIDRFGTHVPRRRSKTYNPRQPQPARRCACGCGELITDAKSGKRQYVNGTHARRAQRARKGVS
jgi:hypothetical protein